MSRSRTSFGGGSEIAVTGDGRYSATAAVFTLRRDDARQDAQDEATYGLVEHTVCGTS